LLGLSAQEFGQVLRMGWEVGIADPMLVQVAVDTTLVVEPSRLPTKAQPIKAGQNEADQQTKAC
jgi:hypothetical protein